MESMKTNENQWKSHDFRTVAPVTRTIFDEKAFALRDLQSERYRPPSELAKPASGSASTFLLPPIYCFVNDTLYFPHVDCSFRPHAVGASREIIKTHEKAASTARTCVIFHQ